MGQIYDAVVLPRPNSQIDLEHHLLQHVTKDEFEKNMSLDRAIDLGLHYYIDPNGHPRNKPDVSLSVIRETAQRRYSLWYGILDYGKTKPDESIDLFEPDIQIRIKHSLNRLPNWEIFSDDLDKAFNNNLEEKRTGIVTYNRIVYNGDMYLFKIPITRSRLTTSMSLRNAKKHDLTYFIGESGFGSGRWGDFYMNMRNSRGDVYVIRNIEDKATWRGVLNFAKPSEYSRENLLIEILEPRIKRRHPNWELFKQDLNTVLFSKK